MRFPTDPVGLPGLAALAIGLLAFLLALLAARRRGSRHAKSAIATRNRASWIWVAVQGIGMGCTGFGPVRVTLDPLSALALANAVAVLVLVAGSARLFDVSSRTMGRNWALVARTRQDGQLVQSGPFAVIRNPIYVALFGVLLGMAMAWGHMRNLIVAVPVFALGTGMRVRHEEAVLRATFGAAYGDYARRVRRFVPGVF